VAAILDRQSGKRYGQVQFLNEVVDFITSGEGRQPCYDLLDGLHSMQAGRPSAVSVVTLGDEPGIPKHLRGSTYLLVDGESDAEKFDREWRAAKYLKPQEAAELLRVEARTVKRWAQIGKLAGFRTPGGHWRIDEEAVRRMQHGGQPMTTAASVAEIDLGPCAVCTEPILAGEEYVSVIEASVDGTITKVSNQHATCPATRLPTDER